MATPDWPALLAEKDAKIAELLAIIEELRAEIGKNSLNSSLPPSRDNKEARSKRRDRAAKHARRRSKDARRDNRTKRSSLLPSDLVTSSEDHRPSHCADCGTRLLRCNMTDTPDRFQQVELPELRLLVHEIRVHSGECPCCGVVTRADQPASANRSKVGPCLRTLLMLLVGRFHLSRREACEFVHDVFGVNLSLGLLSKIEAQTSSVLAPITEEAATAVRDAPVVHADETSWSVGGIPHWLWVATTGSLAVFSIAAGRGAREAQALLGKRRKGVTVSDRWVAYTRLGRRQVCWAHLERNAQALIDRGGRTVFVGLAVVAFVREMFSLWHQFLDRKLSRAAMRSAIESSGDEMLRRIQLLAPGSRLAESFVAGVLKVKAHLFTFTRVKGVEPTNNLAERHLRPGVMWRRKCQGAQSPRGCRFVEQMLSIAVSCRAQGRSVFEFLRQAIHGLRPSLLPSV